MPLEISVLKLVCFRYHPGDYNLTFEQMKLHTDSAVIRAMGSSKSPVLNSRQGMYPWPAIRRGCRATVESQRFLSAKHCLSLTSVLRKYWEIEETVLGVGAGSRGHWPAGMKSF